jgi:hypothetical protein
VYTIVTGALSYWGLSRIQWNWDWLGRAVWLAVPLSFLGAIRLSGWLHRWRSG